MKNPLFHILSIVSAGLVAGCFSLESASPANTTTKSLYLSNGQEVSEHVVISNYGWYLFNRYPVVCGNARPNKRSPFAFFRNDVDENVLQERLMGYISARDCNALDINVFNNEEVLMTIGVGGVALPIPDLLTFRELQYSAVLVRRAEKPKADEPATSDDVRQEMREEMRKLLDRIPDGDAK